MTTKNKPLYDEIYKRSKNIGENIDLNDKCIDIYNQLEEKAIPILTDNLELQIKIEQLAINYYVKGFKKSSEIYKPKISSLKFGKKKWRKKYEELKIKYEELK